MQQLPQKGRYSKEANLETKKKNVMAKRQTRSDVQDHTNTSEKTQESVKTPVKKTDNKKPDKSYQDILALPETGEILLLISNK